MVLRSASATVQRLARTSSRRPEREWCSTFQSSMSSSASSGWPMTISGPRARTSSAESVTTVATSMI